MILSFLSVAESSAKHTLYNKIRYFNVSSAFYLFGVDCEVDVAMHRGLKTQTANSYYDSSTLTDLMLSTEIKIYVYLHEVTIGQKTGDPSTRVIPLYQCVV